MDTMAIMISLLLSMCAVACVKSLDLQLLTIATNSNDGLRRYTKSADKYGYKYKVLGMGQAWDGGDIDKYPGGGQKINILKEGLKDYAQQEYLLVMFTDSFDVILTNTPEEIIRKFQKLDARVVFSAEGFCWPDTSLAEQYPKVKPQEKRFLNSGGFIGYAKDVFEIVNHRPVNNRDDDQLYYTSIFLDKDLRKKWNIKLDVRSEIFQNLNGALDDVQLKSKGSSSYLYNVKTGTTPVVIHGNGPIKPAFNRLANYLADGWTQSNGCQSCLDETISLEGLKEDEFPSVTLAYMVETPTPFLEESLIYLKDIDYPKSKIDLFIHNKVEKHESLLQQYVEVFQSAYHSVSYIPSTEPMSEPDARNKALEYCLKKSCQYFFNVDSIAQISREETLKDLIQQNRTVLAPMMPKKYKLWSNFWGALNKNGFYSRSEDYIDILEYKKIGLWNVPFISVVYLVHGSIVPSLVGSYADNSPDNLDPDMAFCRNVRQMGTFMFVSNREKFGHQVETENYAVNQLYSDFYDIFNNPWDWERRYIHVNYSQSFNESIPLAQPCPDVFWFPIVSDKFTDELIGTMESFGRWSGGRDNHKDERLSGGYENVPTVDIHMNQVGLEPLWLHFLKRYVSPLQARAFAGYVSDPPRAVMNFVVRYRPDEQPLLRPHHDASTFTINIGLNTPDKDYTGGGCRFIRYDCSVTATRKGWMLMHPGRLTHYHEGLPTKSGTRYIMVSFVDP